MTYIATSTVADSAIVTLLSHTLKVELLEELQATLRRLDCKRIVVAGRNGFFAAGADIAELTQLSGPQAVDFARFGQNVYRSIEKHQSVVIAAIDGYCMGGGLDLALACDLRYATAKSVLAHPGGRIGIMTGWGGTQRLPRIIGKSRALEMMAVGRRVTADEAADWGLINGIAEDPVAHALQIQL